MGQGRFNFGVSWSYIEFDEFEGTDLDSVPIPTQPFLVVGLGLLSAEYIEGRRITSFATRLGGGLDVYATRHIVVSASATYVIPTGENRGLEFATFGLGAQYRF